jgi:hypothetical protein
MQSKLPIVEDTAPLPPVALATPTQAVLLSAEFALSALTIGSVSAPETSGTAARHSRDLEVGAVTQLSAKPIRVACPFCRRALLELLQCDSSVLYSCRPN